MMEALAVCVRVEAMLKLCGCGCREPSASLVLYENLGDIVTMCMRG